MQNRIFNKKVENSFCHAFLVHSFLAVGVHSYEMGELLMAIFAFSEHKRDKLTRILDIVLHEGLLTYNPKSSKAHILEQQLAKEKDKRHKKGAIFAVRDKADFTASGVKGYIITSKETLIEQADKITHFTPNVFRRFQYVDQERRYIKGFEEENLQQINTFVIDIDTKSYSVNEILLACIDDSIGEPTLILASDRGYQVYFALTEPMFLSNKNKFQSLKVAKRISENLKRSLASIEADMYCNDFGFFRMPNHQNVQWFNELATYNPTTLIAWSQRQDADRGRGLFVVPQKTKSPSLLNADWFYQLIQTTDVKGRKGQIGRNNLLFTLALVCYQDGRDQTYAFDLLDEYNSQLSSPLKPQDLNKILESAYSGRYHGPKKEYVEQLLALYAPSEMDMPISFGQSVWYKHKKARADRERSHFDEWEEDISKWITAEKQVSEPFIWRTQKELCNEIGIASSSLNKLLKQSNKLLKTTTGKGRNAKTGWTTVEHYIAYIIWLKKDAGTRFASSISTMIDEHLALLAPIAGYAKLVNYVQKMRQIQSFTEQLTMTETMMHTG
ncbi:primase C-terminal domain-containing protein [Lysinibacillus sp. NPDC096418]|uniref:primase C-terminal domain-containing protein n=1 Tax=Lysinibacillus sp. NPDC096418 TaxID=3364138 RepID=UPI0038006470